MHIIFKVKKSKIKKKYPTYKVTNIKIASNFSETIQARISGIKYLKVLRGKKTH